MITEYERGFNEGRLAERKRIMLLISYILGRCDYFVEQRFKQADARTKKTIRRIVSSAREALIETIGEDK